MPRRRSSVARWISIVGGVVCLGAFAVWLVLQLSQGDLDRGDKVASIISMSVTVVTLPLSVLAVVITLSQGRHGDKPAIPTITERLDAMAEILALLVRTQWETEEQVRRIHDPFPLPTRWTNAADELVDHWENIHGDPAQRHPIDLNDHGGDIVDTFRVIPSGRLVVLGQAGAGKTILASRFVLTFLASRPMPVPVIFSLGSWDPTVRSLRDWQIEQLVATYPILSDHDTTDTTFAEQLLATGRIMPVLDGFDEISEGLRVTAITTINAGLRPGEWLLLTSRPREYAAAVRGGDVLTAAAVVRLEALTVADLATYLPLTTRKSERPDARNKWQPVLDHLGAGAAWRSPLATVLSTPLMVALARAIYSDTSKDPRELLDAASPATVENRLLSGFIPAIYSTNRRHGQHTEAHDAGRWLGFLAAHLNGRGTYDLAWWQLVGAVPRAVVGVTCGAAMTLMVLLGTVVVCLVGAWPNGARTASLVAGVVTSLAWGAATGLVLGLTRGLRRSPETMRLRITGRLRDLRRDLPQLRDRTTVTWIAGWLGAGATLGVAASLFANSRYGVLFGLAGGLIAGYGIRLVVFVVRTLATPLDPSDIASPSELLRTDRDTALYQGLAFGVSSSTVLWLTVWWLFEPTFSVPFGRVFAHGLWVLGWLLATGPALLWMMFVAVWGPWLIARSWLPLTGRLPWSVMTFLDDAHRRGVLRQAGGIYQFRHARLQDHLARQQKRALRRKSRRTARPDVRTRGSRHRIDRPGTR